MRVLLVSLFLLIALTLSAQNAKIDSLKKVIATTKVDSVKGRSLCRLCDAFQQTNTPQQGKTYAEQGLRYCQKAKDIRGLAHCYLVKAKICISLEQNEEALAGVKQSLKYYQMVNDSGKRAYCLTLMGVCYLKLAQYQEAVVNLEQALRIAKKGNGLELINNAANALGIAYENLGHYPQALRNYREALTVAEKFKKDRLLIINPLVNIANVLRINKSYDQALATNQRILSYLDSNKEWNIYAGILQNIGNVYHDQNRVREALVYYQKSLAIREAHADSAGIADMLNNLSSCHIRLREFETARVQALASMRLHEKFGNLSGLCLDQINLSNAYLSLGQPRLARQYAMEAYRSAVQMQYLELMHLAAIRLSEADSALGDWKSAFEHHKLYKQYADSLHNEDKAKEFGRIESKYQFEKEAEEQKRKVQEAKRLEQEATERRNNLQYLSIFAGILGLFGTIAFLGRFRIPARVLDVALFASLLILFEFLLILFDPILDDFTGGIPVQKLVFNSVIALGFAPLHGFLEGKLRKRFALKDEKN